MAALRRKKPRNLSGRVVVVTGAANGIGAATSRLLLAQGARVALLDVDDEALGRCVAEFTSDTPQQRFGAYHADVRSRDSMADALARAHDDLGPIHCVVANAGVIGPIAAVTDVDPDAFEHVIDIDLLGVWRTVHTALPYLLAADGHLVLVGSAASVIPTPTFAAYGAAKAGVESLGRTLRIELAPTGVTVGIAYFGLVDTGMVRDDLMQNTPIGALASRSNRLRVLRSIPVEEAAKVLVEGISRRSRRIWAPRWVVLVLEGRTLVQKVDGVLALRPEFTAHPLPVCQGGGSER